MAVIWCFPAMKMNLRQWSSCKEMVFVCVIWSFERKYLEIIEETIDGVVMGNVECLLDDPALRLKILSKAGFLYFGAIEDKDRQLSGFLEVLVSYHGISKLTIAKMADVEEQDIDRLLANPPEKVEIEVKYKIAVTVMEQRF